MPEHIRALIVILFLAAVVFIIARKAAVAIVPSETFARWRNLWLATTLCAFLAHNFWLYCFLAALLVYFSKQREETPLALFFLLLFVIPPFPVEIPGFGMINYLTTVDQPRLLELVILLPLALSLMRRSDTQSFGSTAIDKLFLGYLLLVAALLFRVSKADPWTFTNLLRDWLDLFIDVFLPYYVASRSLKTLQQFKTVLLAFLLAAMVLAMIGLFEFSNHWLVYSALIDSYDLQWNLGNYLGRSNMLRSMASVGDSIALGYVLAIALGLYLFLQKYLTGNFFYRQLGGLLLAGGLVAALSRGPWVGAMALIIIFTATGRHALRRSVLLVLTGLALLPVVFLIPGGEAIINLLPFVGEAESGTIDYRERLIDNSLIVIERYPFFGSRNALEEPEMQAMTQGEGIVDVVNTYIGVALNNGLVTLIFFVGFFGLVTLNVLRTFRRLPYEQNELRLLGRSLFSVLCSILLIITTVSSISVIPVIYWSIAGIGVAYTTMVQKLNSEERRH